MAGSSIFFDTAGASISPEGSSVMFDTTGAAILPRGSSIFFDAGGVISNNLIRGPQFKYGTIDVDRFTNNILSVVTSINAFDLTTSATTNLYTVPAGNTLILSGVIIRITSSTNVTADAQVSVGINPSTDDIFATETLIQTRDFNNVWSFWAGNSTTAVITAGQTIDLTTVMGATADLLLADIYLLGLLITN